MQASVPGAIEPAQANVISERRKQAQAHTERQKKRELPEAPGTGRYRHLELCSLAMASDMVTLSWTSELQLPTCGRTSLPSLAT
jgi:hypothetical protein